MPIDTLTQMLIHLGISFTIAVVTLIISLLSLFLIDHFIYKQIDFIEEIKKGNIAASIFFSVVLIFVAIIMTNALN